MNLNELCKDVITLISSHLDKTDESQKIKSERMRHFPIFRSDIIQKNRILARLAQFAFEGKVAQVAKLAAIRPDLRQEVLFTLAGLAAQDEMEPLLKQHPEYLLVSRPLRDVSGAVFEPISVFQHCLWTKDVRYMANMMLDCLPHNELGEAIRLKLVSQYDEHMAKGATYLLKGVRYEKEQHFNLQPLITALRIYIENYDNWTEQQREEHWCAVVGLRQTLIPAHIRHHYCDHEGALWVNPNFIKPRLKRSLQICDFFSGDGPLWVESLGGLGSDFGIFRREGGLVRAHGDCRLTPLAATRNLCTLRAIDKARTEIDLPALIERLSTPIQNHDLGLQKMDLKP